jgi:hypothetical protein
MIIRLVLVASLLLGSAACSDDESTSLSCEEAFELLNEDQKRLIDELGSDAPIFDFNFPAECFDQ